MEKDKNRMPSLVDYFSIGLRLGAFLVGLATIVALALFVWSIYRSRTGRPGWELMALPATVTVFYLGWTMGESHARRRRAKARRKRREEAENYAARSADNAQSVRSQG